jgi:tryptophanyl-tRNA synthetase
LSDSPEEVAAKVGRMITDPQRARKADPGNPDVCNVYEFHRLYSDQATQARIDGECRNAKIGCVDCKKIMAKHLIQALEPIHAKQAYYTERPQMVDEIMLAGSDKARQIAQQTMAEVKAAMKIT